MKHESAVQAVKELMRKDSVFRSVIQGWGVATLLIGIFMFYMGANTYIQSYKQTDWVFGSAYITDISELNRSKVGRRGINYSMTYEYEWPPGKLYRGGQVHPHQIRSERPGKLHRLSGAEWQ